VSRMRVARVEIHPPEIVSSPADLAGFPKETVVGCRRPRLLHVPGADG
jgi:hypothetical protein